MNPVHVGALGPLALHADGVPGIADHGGVGRDVLDHDRVGADLGVVADRDRAQQLGPRADGDVVLEGGMALPGLEASAAEGHALEQRHAVADLGRLADHDARAVVDEEVRADSGGGVDLDPGEGAAGVGENARRERHLGVPERVRDAVGQQGLHAGPAGEDLQGADALGGGVALTRG